MEWQLQSTIIHRACASVEEDDIDEARERLFNFKIDCYVQFN
jgi:hypothetical protein